MRSVLIVDDDSNWLFLLGMKLEREGFHVTTATNVVAALRILTSGDDTFDLIIADLHMPRADGLELRDSLLSHPGRPIPFIFVSSLRDAESVRAANDLGVPHFLEKSGPIADLVDLARSLAG